MTDLPTKKNFIDTLKKYVSEIFIIVIGISVSFTFDEWKDNRKDDETAKKLLTALRANLVQDTTVLTGMMEIGKIMARSTSKLAYFKYDSEIVDSLNFHIDNAASYLDFKSNETAYEEIKQSANTKLIKADTLKGAFLGYYTNIVSYCAEWTDVDKAQVMKALIPEMNTYFPVVPDTLNLVSAQEKIKALRTKKLRNLLLQSAVYKLETIKILNMSKQIAKSLIKRIDDELKK